ncbi:MAG: hypothetical protein GY760_17010 [Deltaproteobacteria bacterium]|nr:hypothetical protein [Deltaproteobacteria bacterium]
MATNKPEKETKEIPNDTNVKIEIIFETLDYNGKLYNKGDNIKMDQTIAKRLASKNILKLIK